MYVIRPQLTNFFYIPMVFLFWEHVLLSEIFWNTDDIFILRLRVAIRNLLADRNFAFSKVCSIDRVFILKKKQRVAND